MRQRGGPSSTPDMTFDASEDGHSSFPSPNLLLTPAQHGTGPFNAYGEFSVFERCNDAPLNNWYYYYGPPAPGHPDFQNKQLFMTSASTTPIIPATVKTESPGASESVLASRPVGAPGNAHNSGRTVADNQDENVEPGLPPDLSGLLSGSERQALYDSLSGILGPPNGIEESVGTYKAYMQRQSQIYYESLLPSPNSSSIAGYHTSVASSSVLHASQAGLDYAPPPQQNNPGLALSTPYSMHPIGPPHAQGIPRPQRDELRKLSGRSTPANLNAGPAPLVHPGTPSSIGVDASRFGTPHGYAHLGGALELGDIIESPLLRSRNPSTYGHGHALYAVNPAHAQAQAQAHHPWYPAQAFADPTGYAAVNPVYRPATIGHVPIWQPPYMPAVPAAISAPSSSAQWERGNFTAMLQDAIHTSAETTASPGSSQEANKDKRLDPTGQRSGQTRTDSRGA
ncbi:hypothetical protein DAEQUDRAFT_554717 [Daedalea quercina L-15889]|uniref:Uncharacterized protein n=1 Tax=Daedalea quercina L-15889 TaxID=1314783 RepID=A0A165T5A5_9APHY|nr:hypothetical protein DAEQUDRAFT_554717 [Daedalea quercina L-15889]